MTDSTPMVERVMAAIEQTYDCPFGRGEIVNLMEVAKAALLALREPSEEMIREGHLSIVYNDGDVDLRNIWQAMIDKALNS